MSTLKRLKRWIVEEYRLRPKQKFQYTRLGTEPGTAFIRLLDLEYDGDGDIIRCHLRDVDLKATPKPVYEAVSYSWRRDILRNFAGSYLPYCLPRYFPQHETEGGGVSRPILCNDQVLEIQPNLYNLLVRLRQKERRLPLWIDAICIDQDPKSLAKNEKRQQLKIMGDIYKSAEAVLVWLGESSNVSSSLSEFLQSLPSEELEYRSYWTEHDILHDQPSGQAIMQTIGLDHLVKASSNWRNWSSSIWAGFKRSYQLGDVLKVLNRDYFRRAWVIQEVLLARELIFLVGPMEIRPDHLLNGIRVISSIRSLPFLRIGIGGTQSAGFLAIPHILKSRDDLLKGNQWEFQDYLFLCRDRLATEPEDKVYAICGLVEEELRNNLYDRARQDDGTTQLDILYVDCARALAHKNDWPYVLSLAGIGTASDGRRIGSNTGNDPPLASWVPDFRLPLQPKPLWFYGGIHYRAATSVPPTFEVSENPWTLRLSVVHIDIIEQVGESGDELHVSQIGYAEGHILDLVTRLGKKYRKSQESTIDALMRTLTADIFMRHLIMSHELRAEFIEWLEEELFSLLESNMTILKRVLNPIAMSLGVSSVRDTPKINGTHLSKSNAILSFLKTFDGLPYLKKGMSELVRQVYEKKYPQLQQLNFQQGEDPHAKHQKSEPTVSDTHQLQAPSRPRSHSCPRLRPYRRRPRPHYPRSFSAPPFCRNSRKAAKTQAAKIARGGGRTSGEESFYEFLEGRRITKAIFSIYKHRRIFRTRDQNFLGIGPSDIKRGDIVSLVAGAPTPFIFRKIEDCGSSGSDGGKERLRLVGSAYVHGVMYGEWMRESAGVEFKEVAVI